MFLSLLSSALNGSRYANEFQGILRLIVGRKFCFLKISQLAYLKLFLRWQRRRRDDAVKMHFRPSLSPSCLDFCVRAIPVYVDGEKYSSVIESDSI